MIRQEMGDGPSAVRRLVLWRHGRTEWNMLGRAQGHADVELDDLGLAQADRAAGFLATYEPVFVWSSDLARARQTAERLAAVVGIEVVLDKRLREFDVGGRQGLTFAEFKERFPREYDEWASSPDQGVRLLGAETGPEVAARMVEALRAAAEAIPDGGTGVVVGHGAALRIGLLAFLGLPPELWGIAYGMSNGAWAVLEHSQRGWRLLDYNAQTLPEPLDLPDDPL